jgi:signal transduction histidine kinase
MSCNGPRLATIGAVARSFRLPTIALFSVLTSALSLIALMRALTMSEAQRHERARDAVSGEVARLARLNPSAESLAQPATTSFIGMRGGWARAGEALADLPAEWAGPVAAAIGGAAVHQHVVETPVEHGTLVVAAAPVSGGRIAWAGVVLPPSTYLRPWRFIAFGLAIATALLVASAMTGVWIFRRDVRGLRANLVALGRDLSTPVATPSIADLAVITDGIRAMARELLDSRRTRDELAQRLAQEERLSALGRVAAGVAHEVRNPLAAIKLRLDLTAAQESLPAATRTAVESASREIARLDRLVSDLLLLAGRKPGPRGAVDLRQLAAARAEAMADWAAQREVKISVAAGGRVPLSADVDSLTRALDNLLRNAVEASPAGASVDVAVEMRGETAELVVEDAGSGVPATREAELFEPFFTTKPEGTGLGLAISRAIARSHGGELSYDRTAARTRFVITLPAEKAVGEAA